MSFAASLSRTSSDIKHQREEEIDAWVSKQVDTLFKPACQAAASQGAFFVQCTSIAFKPAVSLSPALENVVSDEIKECFLTKIFALGFANWEVKDARNCDGFRWSLWAELPHVPKR
mmetsp:Transcript_88255/g.252877  ORF Transcript_88255/g.252877 Transcript_88255/m.252877 type:complete len:116 (+) Transcript_88255:69-416(+)